MSQYIPKRVMVVVVMVMFLVSILTLNSIGLLSYLAFAQNNNDSNKLIITDGIASGDVTDNSAIIWSRANAQSLMHVQYDTTASFSYAKPSKTLLVNKSTDFAGQIKIDSLFPDTLYYYRVWFSLASDNVNTTNSSKGSLSLLPTSDSTIGNFRTAPNHLTSSSSSTNNRTISFVIGGDLGGQNYCRRDGTGGIQGYPIFSIMQSLSPDFFIFNGDQIYGDNACSANGPANVTGWKKMMKDIFMLR